MWEAELAADPQVAASSLAARLVRVPGEAAGIHCGDFGVGGARRWSWGNDSVTAIWQWAAGSGQYVLVRIDARRDALTGWYPVPSEATFRRVMTRLDGGSET